MTQIQPMAGEISVIRLPTRFEDEPMKMVCNICREHIKTETIETCNPICFFMFGCFGLCLCQDVEHRCPKCNASLGMYRITDEKPC